MSEMSKFAAASIKLNVGGTFYETTLSVLRKVEDSMLGRMFGNWGMMLKVNPVDGCVFIERDVALFGLIMSFLGDLDTVRVKSMIYELSESEQDK
jgi:hypothetical protein